jgi:hypothetical protein
MRLPRFKHFKTIAPLRRPFRHSLFPFSDNAAICYNSGKKEAV